MKQEKQDIINYTQTLRVEYFDDRFYKIQMPDNYNPDKLIYKNLYQESELGKFLYLPSVTTYLSFVNEPSLNQWRGEVGNEYADYKMNRAGELGTKIHDVINARCNGYDVIFHNPKYPAQASQNIDQYATEINDKLCVIDSQDVAVQLARFEDIISALDAEIIESEQIVYSVNELYAGTLDMIIRIPKDTEYTTGRTLLQLKKGYYIVDFKTGKYINELKYFSQLAAYSKAVKLSLKGALIFHLNSNIKTGIKGTKIFYKNKKELNQYFKYFKNIKSAFLFQLKDFNVTNYEIPIYFNSKLKIKQKGKN